MPTALANLLAVIARSGLSRVRFAPLVMGRAPRTLFSWLAQGELPPVAADWSRRLVRVDVVGDEIHVVLRVGEVGEGGAGGAPQGTKKPRG